MIFNTYWFVLFTVVFFPGYWLIRWPAARGWWLLCGCAVFHTHFAGPAGVVPIVVLGALTTIWILSQRIFGDVPVGGWTSTFVGILIVGGATLLSLGIIAQYVGAATNMSLGKPLYVVVSDPRDTFGD